MIILEIIMLTEDTIIHAFLSIILVQYWVSLLFIWFQQDCSAVINISYFFMSVMNPYNLGP